MAASIPKARPATPAAQRPAPEPVSGGRRVRGLGQDDDGAMDGAAEPVRDVEPEPARDACRQRRDRITSSTSRERVTSVTAATGSGEPTSPSASAPIAWSRSRSALQPLDGGDAPRPRPRSSDAGRASPGATTWKLASPTLGRPGMRTASGRTARTGAARRRPSPARGPSAGLAPEASDRSRRGGGALGLLVEPLEVAGVDPGDLADRPADVAAEVEDGPRTGCPEAVPPRPRRWVPSARSAERRWSPTAPMRRPARRADPAARRSARSSDRLVEAASGPSSRGSRPRGGSDRRRPGARDRRAVSQAALSWAILGAGRGIVGHGPDGVGERARDRPPGGHPGRRPGSPAGSRMGRTGRPSGGRLRCACHSPASHARRPPRTYGLAPGRVNGPHDPGPHHRPEERTSGGMRKSGLRGATPGRRRPTTARRGRRRAAPPGSARAGRRSSASGRPGGG